VVRYRTYEVLKEEVANPQLRWAYLPYSMHMAGPREAIQVRIEQGVRCTAAAGDEVKVASAGQHGVGLQGSCACCYQGSCFEVVCHKMCQEAHPQRAGLHFYCARCST
jgi:ATP-sulfurylase